MSASIAARRSSAPAEASDKDYAAQKEMVDELKFEVELLHTVKPVILVDLKVRFLLGDKAMGPDDPVLPPDLADGLRARRALYRAGRPFRLP